MADETLSWLAGEQAMVAEQLYDVLSDPAVTRRRLPVLLAANKADCGAKAHTPDFIRKRLEKALGELRGTRASLAADETGAGAKVGPLPVLIPLALTLSTGALPCWAPRPSPCPLIASTPSVASCISTSVQVDHQGRHTTACLFAEGATLPARGGALA